MDFKDLNTAVRAEMRSEIESDIANGRLYLSPRLSQRGLTDYPSLLLEAADHGTPASLAAELRQCGRLRSSEMSHSKTGRPIEKKVPSNASETLAEGEFNRYYCRGACLVAISQDGEVEVDRVKAVNSPRAESQAMLSRRERFDPAQLLQDLRSNVGVDTALGLPPGPNSGLSVKIVPLQNG